MNILTHCTRRVWRGDCLTANIWLCFIMNIWFKYLNFWFNLYNLICLWISKHITLGECEGGDCLITLDSVLNINVPKTLFWIFQNMYSNFIWSINLYIAGCEGAIALLSTFDFALNIYRWNLCIFWQQFKI